MYWLSAFIVVAPQLHRERENLKIRFVKWIHKYTRNIFKMYVVIKLCKIILNKNVKQYKK